MAFSISESYKSPALIFLLNTYVNLDRYIYLANFGNMSPEILTQQHQNMT